jgi:hypothetical protein
MELNLLGAALRKFCTSFFGKALDEVSKAFIF